MTAVEAAAGPNPTTVSPPAQGGLPRVEILDIRPAGQGGSDSAGPSANQPATATRPAAVDSLTALITELEEAVKANPHQIEDQFRLRLLYAATGQEEKATGPLPGVDPVQGEMVAALVRAVIEGRRSMEDPTGAGPLAVATLDEARRMLSQQLPVLVPKMALVTRVNSFGDYEAVNPPEFPAGQPVHVFLYTEVANFRSEPIEGGRLRTVLAEKVEIFDAQGKVIFSRSEPTIEDRTHSPRRDFFMTMEIQLPPDTPPGEYVLKVTIEDKLSATTDQGRMTFRIVGK